MSKCFKYIIPLLLALLFQWSFQPLTAQDNKQMFMFKVDGNNYFKKSYDKKGRLKGFQVFKVGKVKKEKNQYTMPLKVYAYNENGELKDSAATQYTCKPSDHQVLMSIFPFAEFSTNKTVKIELSSGNKLYPVSWETGKELTDVSLVLSLDGGMLGAFGTSSRIKIYDRKVTSHDTLRNFYTVTARMQIKAYMFSIPMDGVEYTIEETINPEKGILNQRFKEDNGESFTITMKRP